MFSQTNITIAVFVWSNVFFSKANLNSGIPNAVRQCLIKQSLLRQRGQQAK